MSNIWSVLSQSASVFVVALLVLAVQKLFADKLNPKWQSYLWWIVIIVTFLPVGFLGTSSLVNFNEIIDTFRIRIEMGLNSSYSSAWSSEFVFFPLPITPKTTPSSVTDILFIAYILWIVLSGIYFISAYVRLHLKISNGVPINSLLVEEVAVNYNLPKPYKITESKQAKTPFVMGVFRPTLVIPMGKELDEKVVIHELLHLKHKDIILGVITTIIRVLHPVTWLLCNQMDNDRERACDQSVLELLEGEQRRDYGIILLSMVNNNSIHTPGATAMANGGKHIKKRIASIVNFRKFPKGMELVSFCMIFVLMMTIFGGTSTSATEFDSNNYASAIAFGQNNKPTTAAAALDFYTTGKYQEYWRKYRNLAYLSAVTDPSNMEEIYLEWEKTSEFNIDDLDNAFRTGPIIRGLSLGDNGDYICEVYFFRDELGEDFDVRYRKTIVSLKETDGYWTVTELAETEDVIAGDDTMYLKDNHSSVVWTAEIDGYTLEVSSIGMTCV
ncbi:MAG: M56 family metallopeptidase, partial [Clostridia bacterium]